MNKKPKILLIDLETCPSLGYVWQKWQTDVIAFKEDWHILSFAAKWLGSKKMISYGLNDFKTFKKNKDDDRELVQKLWELMDEADVIMAHNGDEFDVKKANARFISHGLNPPSPYITIDTKKVAKRYFKFDSNSLDELGRYLGLGRKLHHTGFNMWLGCMNGDLASWKMMLKYNRYDVILLEKVYLKLRGWMKNAPNLNSFMGTTSKCPNCGKSGLQKRGFGYNRTSQYQRYQCIGPQGCGAWSTGEKIKRDKVLVK